MGLWPRYTIVKMIQECSYTLAMTSTIRVIRNKHVIVVIQVQVVCLIFTPKAKGLMRVYVSRRLLMMSDILILILILKNDIKTFSKIIISILYLLKCT